MVCMETWRSPRVSGVLQNALAQKQYIFIREQWPRVQYCAKENLGVTMHWVLRTFVTALPLVFPPSVLG